MNEHLRNFNAPFDILRYLLSFLKRLTYKDMLLVGLDGVCFTVKFTSCCVK